MEVGEDGESDLARQPVHRPNPPQGNFSRSVCFLSEGDRMNRFDRAIGYL